MLSCYGVGSSNDAGHCVQLLQSVLQEFSWATAIPTAAL